MDRAYQFPVFDFGQAVRLDFGVRKGECCFLERRLNRMRVAIPYKKDLSFSQNASP